MHVISRLTLLLCICVGLFSPWTVAEAEVPAVAVFNYSDSLAIEVDCSELFTVRRVDLLQHGYPLSFVLSVALFRDDRIWLDSRLAEASARFRVVHQAWDDKFALELSDFYGVSTSDEYRSLNDIVHLLEERLFMCFGDVSSFSGPSNYYFELEVEYRSLTFQDVKSADRWLRDGSTHSDDSASSEGKSIGEGILGFLWNVVGLRAERDKLVTEKFKPSQLRRGR